MRLTIALVIGLVLVTGVSVAVIVEIFDPKEWPKVAGAALGAVISAGMAFLVFALSRRREMVKASEDLVKLEKAYWLDTWTTLPVVYEELVYWRTRSGQSTGVSATAMYPRALDIIVEHLRSQFFDTNLNSIIRLSMEAQTSLMVFHDNLRIVRERLVQVIPLLVEFEKRLRGDDRVVVDDPWIRARIESGPAPYNVQSDETRSTAKLDFNDPWMRDRLIDIGVLSKELAEVLESALLHGWAAQQTLDREGKWAQEQKFRDDGNLPGPTAAWLGGIMSLLSARERQSPPAVPDDKQ